MKRRLADLPRVVMMEVVTDPEELAAARVRWEQADRNAAWLQAHASEIYPKYRGKCLCVAGEELFVGDTGGEALTKARSAHPEDNGIFIHYIPLEKTSWIYAGQR